MPSCRYGEENGSATMLAAKRSVGVTPLPSANKAAHSGFETQRRRYQKSKTGVSVVQQKGLMSSKKVLKKRLNCRQTVAGWMALRGK